MSDDDEPESDEDNHPVGRKGDADYERPDDWADNLQVVEIDVLATAIAYSTTTRGLDWYVTQRLGLSAKDWAYITNRSKQTVDRNVTNLVDEIGAGLPPDDAYDNMFDPVMFTADPVIGYESDNDGNEGDEE